MQEGSLVASIQRERVQRVIAHQEVNPIPYHIEFTLGARKRMAAYLNDANFEARLGNFMITAKALPAGCPREVRPGHIQDDFGVIWDRTVDETCGVPLPVLAEPTLADYAFPDPDDPSRYAGLADFSRDPGGHFRVLKMSHALFERAWALRGFEQFFLDLHLFPDFTEELLTRITEFNLRVLENVHRIVEIDAVWFGDDWGAQHGPLMSQELWRERLRPHLARLFAKTREYGWTVMLHCCGAVECLLPDLIELGVEVFNPFQPEVMDVFAIKKKFGRELTFFGGLSIQRVLPFGTPAEVRRETRRLIDEIGRDGGYILSPAHALPHDVPPENVMAMIEEAQRT